MKKRLRKKLHLGEFKELGFRVALTFSQEMGEAGLDTFVDNILDEVCEGRETRCAGGGNAKEAAFFLTLPSAQDPDAQKEALLAWFKARPEVASVEAGPFVDAWHEVGVPVLNVGWDAAIVPMDELFSPNELGAIFPLSWLGH